MASLSTVRDTIKVQLGTIASLRVSKYLTFKVNISADTHQAMITEVKRGFHESLGDVGDSNPLVTVVILTGKAGNDMERAQEARDEYCDVTGNRSVRAALEANDSLEVKDCEQTGMEISGEQYVAAVFTVEVYN